MCDSSQASSKFATISHNLQSASVNVHSSTTVYTTQPTVMNSTRASVAYKIDLWSLYLLCESDVSDTCIAHLYKPQTLQLLLIQVLWHFVVTSHKRPNQVLAPLLPFLGSLSKLWCCCCYCRHRELELTDCLTAFAGAMRLLVVDDAKEIRYRYTAKPIGSILCQLFDKLMGGKQKTSMPFKSKLKHTTEWQVDSYQQQQSCCWQGC